MLRNNNDVTHKVVWWKDVDCSRCSEGRYLGCISLILSDGLAAFRRSVTLNFEISKFYNFIIYFIIKFIIAKRKFRLII